MKIIRLSDVGVESAAAEAAAALHRGGIVLYPTDTLYGLAVDATNVNALRTLREIKGREKKKPISVVVKDVETISDYAHLSERAAELAARHLPGALTIVLEGKANLPQELMLNGALGIRIPDHEFSKALAEIFEKPFTATSANRSGHLTPRTVFEIISQFGPKAEHLTIVVDGGEHPGGTPSTVVKAHGDTFYILREGAISKENIGL